MTEPWHYDGMMTGSPDGTLTMRVFAPRWWQLHRWLRFLLLPRRVAKGWLTLMADDGKFIKVRAYAVEPLASRRR